jgi:hypothetical protein
MSIEFRFKCGIETLSPELEFPGSGWTSAVFEGMHNQVDTTTLSRLTITRNQENTICFIRHTLIA